MKKPSNCSLALLLLLALLLVPPASAQEKFAYPDKSPGEVLKKTLSTTSENPIDVLHYDVNLNILPESRTIRGRTRLTLRPLATSDSDFHLNLIGLTVDSVLVNGKKETLQRQADRFSLPFPADVSPQDSFDVIVYYNGHPGNDGFGGFFFTDRFIYTVGEGLNTNPPSMTRYWIPCNDVPEDKATLDITITVPSPFIAVSNGELVQTTSLGDQQTFHWRETHPIATYLIAIAVGDYAFFSDQYVSAAGDTVPLLYYAYPEHEERAREDWKDVGRMIAFFEQQFIPYPFDKYGMVEVPMRGAMEHQTITSYSSALVTGDHRYDYVVVHELAHQWWGDLVTLKDWRDIWLNEGFASYCEALYVEHINGGKALQAYMDNFATAYFREVGRFGHFPIYDPAYMWGSTIYKKGAWVLHMLRWTVSDSLFWQGMKIYASTFAYANASTDDFKNVFENLTGQNLDWFFEQWIYKAGFPRLQVAWEYVRTAENIYRVSVKITQAQQREELFRLPLEIAFETAQGTILDTIIVTGKENRFHFSLQDRPRDLIIDPNNWVLKKVDIISRPLPAGFQTNKLGLAQNYPNPFVIKKYEKTKITFQVPKINSPRHVSLIIYDVLGREIKRVVDKKLAEGLHTYYWDGRDEQQHPVPGGVYLLILSDGDEVLTRKISLLRN